MPGKQKAMAPIDRPLSKAYLRGFRGWSTAYPPAQSDPTTLRVMENLMVDRNGALQVRPGLRYLSYHHTPDMDPTDDNYPGEAFGLEVVGAQEPFYTLNGERALLFAVREVDRTVGFRALLFSDAFTAVLPLTDPRIDFEIPQGETVMNFSERTTHVSYVQINNRIIAMSNAGEDIRIFFVGNEKVVKRMSNVSVPDWTDADKPTVIHPDPGWIAAQTVSTRTNQLLNPSFEIGTYGWTPSATTKLSTSRDAFTGIRSLQVESRPTRTNMITNPLVGLDLLPENSVPVGWWPLHQDSMTTHITTDQDYLRIYGVQGEGDFYAYSAKAWENVRAGEKYRLAFDLTVGSHVTPMARLSFYAVNGAMIGVPHNITVPAENGRFVSQPVTAPEGAVTMRVWLGGHNDKVDTTYIRVRDVVLCLDGESTDIFTGDSGTNYFWTGSVNKSASVYHPPQTVKVTSARVSMPKRALSGSMYLKATDAYTFDFKVRQYDRVDGHVADLTTSGTTSGSWSRPAASSTLIADGAVSAELELTALNVARGQHVLVDACMLESNVSAPGTYFDGETVPTPTTSNTWLDRNAPHASPSQQKILLGASMPWPATPSETTLMAVGGAEKNPYKMAFFYTFENGIGESAPSKMFEVRVSRPWANWKWETGDGTPTDVAELCADQLAVRIPEAVYTQALAEGAVKWNLYAIAWSDQEPVPVEAPRVGERDMLDTTLTDSLPYLEGGIIYLTPARKIGVASMPLPTRQNRVNYSRPPQARTGLVAGDRVILAGDASAPATIKWSSNQFGEYTNFGANAGGGEKTLTAGNLNLPAAVVLWQNPQSVDTITILCQGEDGRSSCYYMQPATITAGSGSTQVMGFEESTNTPGTLSPWAAEVMNNGLYRPVTSALLKSTASNYNINHKTFSDLIANMWTALQRRHWMMTSQLDNRLYLLVYNPLGEKLLDGCHGNEIWVLDIAAENGNWSRLLVQGRALRPFDVAGRTYMGVTRPEGIYYLDPDHRVDDYVAEFNEVHQRPIPWRFITNIQGANRAHDAWAHLQQVELTVGDFFGEMRYGIRGVDLHGMLVDVSKRVSDRRRLLDDLHEWSITDNLRIARDMREWEFYAESLPGVEGTGKVSLLQYRYTPVSVNVGGEFGSVETFEYGRNVESGPDAYAENGIPRTYVDYRRV